jgi:hypothetical protein
LCSQTIEPRRRHASRAALYADLAPAEIVGEHDDDVRALRRLALGGHEWSAAGDCEGKQKREGYGSRHALTLSVARRR